MGTNYSIQGDSFGIAQASSAYSSNAVGHQRVQNVLLVWLDSNNVNTDDSIYQHTVTQLRQVINEVNTFSDGDRCIEFIKEIKDNKVCVITSGTLGKHIVPEVHGMSQVDSIFIFCNQKKYYERWANDWPKIKGVFTETKPICEALKQVSKECEQDAIPISFVSTTTGASSKNLNQLEPSFMYTEIMKKILFTIKFEQKHFDEFIRHCREHFSDNEIHLYFISQFEKTYQDKTPIWWYTKESFLYRMLNASIRTMDGDLIIKMGFFITDLHHQIEKLHAKQFGGHLGRKIFTVYRGQHLTTGDYNKMKNNPGGLMSFNNFLSTSKKRNVSKNFIKARSLDPASVAILFVMIIDPAQSTTPFASLNQVASFGDKEDEVLFSMHSVFRIGSIKPIDENARLFEVYLTLTSDNDEDLHRLTDSVEQETFPGEKGWHRLGSVLMKMGQFKKAEEVFSILLDKPDNESERGSIYHNIGMAKRYQGEYQQAIQYYNKAIDIHNRTIPPNLPNLAKSYDSIGAVHNKNGNHEQALLFYKKAFSIKKKFLSPNHPELAGSYSNIGSAYDKMGDQSKALSHYNEARVIREKSLPPNHPDLAASYNNLGLLHKTMKDYSKALSFFEDALKIRLHSLPSNHPDLAGSYNNIGSVHKSKGNYSQALSEYKKALQIRLQSLQPNHPDLVGSYSNIGSAYMSMGDYSQALPQYKEALRIGLQSLPSNHPDLVGFYNNIGSAYLSMGDYSQALSKYKKVLFIQQQSLPSDSADLAATEKNIDLVCEKMGAFLEKRIQTGEYETVAKDI